MRVLVTGGLGFLGGWLVDELLDAGESVHVVDDLSSNVLAPAELRPGATVSAEPLRDFLGRIGDRFDAVYHLASVVGPTGVLPHAGRIVADVVADAYAVAEAAAFWQARVLDVSTSEVYGGGEAGFCSEEMPKVVAPYPSARLEYAVGKLAAETALCNLPGLDVVVVRPFNIAGPRQSSRGGFVLPRFAEAAVAGAPLTVYGDGRQVRALTHVRDVATGLRQAMARGRSGEAYNVGNAENRTTILELAELVRKVAGSSSSIEHVDPRDLWGDGFAEAADKWPDPRKAVRELGWAPERDLVEVVEDAVAWASRP